MTEKTLLDYLAMQRFVQYSVCSYFPCQGHLAVGSGQLVSLWNLETGVCVNEFKGHKDRYMHVMCIDVESRLSKKSKCHKTFRDHSFCYGVGGTGVD